MSDPKTDYLYGQRSLKPLADSDYYVVTEVVTKKLGHIPIAKGDWILARG